MIANLFRNELSRVPFLAEAFDLLVSQLNGHLGVQHNPDGTHSDITADDISAVGDLTVAGDVAVGGALTVGTSATVEQSLVFGEAVSAGTVADSADHIQLQRGVIRIGNASTGAMTAATFRNANGTVGSITTNGTTTSFNTTSDATLKDVIGPATTLTGLLALRVQDFQWKDGTTDRGIIAQEAYAVFPRAVTPGTAGTPWMVDYSKFVPDLIVAVQQQAGRIEALEADVALLKGLG